MATVNINTFLDHITTSKTASAPIIGVAGASLLGLSLPEWAAIVTIIYTLMMAYFRVRREYEKRKAKRLGLPEPGDSEMDRLR